MTLEFNQDVAAQVVEALTVKEFDSFRFLVLVYALQETSGYRAVEEAVKNCECGGFDYNDNESAAKYLQEILDRIKVAPINEIFGLLIPRFFCALEQISQKLNPINGKASSEPEQECPEEDSSGS